MLGAWWKLYQPQKTKNINLVFWIAVAALIIIELIDLILFASIKVSLFTMGQSWNVGGWDNVGEQYATFAGKDTAQPFTIICAFAIFILFQKIKLNYHWFLNFLGRLSVPIFLYHFLFMHLINETLAPKILTGITNDEVHGIVTTLLILVSTTIFSAIIIIPVDYLVSKGVYATNFILLKGQIVFNAKINKLKLKNVNNN